MLRSKKTAIAFVILAVVLACALSACNFTITVRFDPNYDGAQVVEKTLQNGRITVPTNVSRNGFVLDGWFEDSQCTKKIGENTKPYDGATYFAKWTALPKSLSVTLNKQVFVGDVLSKDDFVATVTYFDNVVKTVDSSSISADLTDVTAAAGTKQVEFRYTENSTTVKYVLEIEVLAHSVQVEQISVQVDSSVKMFVGDAFNKSALTVTVRYNNGTTATAIATAYEVQGFDSSTAGEKTVTVVYEENGVRKTTTCTVTVTAVQVEQISVQVNSSVKMFVGDSFNKSALTVTVRYNNGTTATAIATAYEVQGFDSSTAGEKTVTVVYEENGVRKTTTCTVTVTAVQVEQISVQVDSSIKMYVGDAFNKSALTVTVRYNNGTTTTATAYEVQGFDSSTAGEKTVTVVYEENGVRKTTTCTVTVTAVQVEQISVQVDSSVKMYVGDAFNKSALTVTVRYNNGTTATATAYEVQGFDSSTAGEKTVTVVYEENGVRKTTTCTVTVSASALVGIFASHEGNVLVGAQPSDSDLTVIATYENGYVKRVFNFNKSTIDSSTVGSKTLEVSYTENGVTKTCQVQINVVQGSVVSNSNLSIHFLELGNKYTGDCVYVKAGDTDILIDAGSRKGSAETIANYVDGFCTDGILEYVIATHAHQDHIAGFVGTSTAPGIFQRYQCETIIEFAKSNFTSQIFKDYKTARDNEVASGANCYTAAQCFNETDGAQRVYQIADGITLEILYNYYYFNTQSDGENDYSVCCMIRQGENCYIFTGDMESKGESKMVDYYNNSNNPLPHCVLYKAGHHGSSTSSTAKLMNAITPEYVCVCCCCGTSEYTDNNNTQFPTQTFVNNVAPHTDKIYVTSIVDNYVGKSNWSSQGTVKSMNGNIVFSCINGVVSVNCSNNNTIFKETEWFKTHRTWPSNGK